MRVGDNMESKQTVRWQGPALIFFVLLSSVAVALLIAATFADEWLAPPSTASAPSSPGSPTSYLVVPDASGTPPEPSQVAETEQPVPHTETIYSETDVDLDSRDVAQYDDAGFLAPDDLGDSLPVICNDMESGGNGMLAMDVPPEVTAAELENLQDLEKALAVKYVCPVLARHMGAGSSAQYVALTAAPATEAPVVQAPIPTVPATQAPLPVSGFVGGSTARCSDGTLTHAAGKQGACSWHGGLK